MSAPVREVIEYKQRNYHDLIWNGRTFLHNSTAGALRMEAYLLDYLSDNLQFWTWKCR